MNRIQLVSATFELLDAAIVDPALLGQLLNAAVAEGWAGFPESLPKLRNSCAKDADDGIWGTQLFLLESPRTLVGLGGYKGPPRGGVVEIGYAIAPAFRGQGLATQASLQMIARAFADLRVGAVDAHTLAHVNPSTRLLQRLGFQRIGRLDDPEDGAIWHWRLPRAALGASS